MAKASQEKIDYNKEYNKKNYANISIRARPEEVEAIKEAAKASGKSLARYVLDCCTQKSLDKSRKE